MLNNNKITSSSEEKLLGIFLDSKLDFESDIGSLCRKAGQKISDLTRLKNYFSSDQRNLLLYSVIKSQFTYCLLIWMFTSRYLNNALNNIHERALRLIYNDYEKSFNSILTENNLKTIHQKNLEFLAIKIYKFQNGLSQPIMNDIFFSRQNIYNLRKFQELSTSTKNTVNFGTKTSSYRGPQLWNLIPDNIKSESNGNVKPVHVEYVKLSATYRFYQLIKILASILPMVRTNLFYHALKHCIGDWESILISY